MSNRFVSVTDRFLAELGPVALNQIPKDLDMKYENLVKALRHVQIKVWPPESFEEGAEFLESLSKSFGNAHGLRLKSTFAETLVQMLHPIGKVCFSFRSREDTCITKVVLDRASRGKSSIVG